MDDISPSYQMKIIDDIEKTIWDKYSSYKRVELYIKKWHVVEDYKLQYWENFNIVLKDSGDIDLLSTLHNIDGATLLKIAIDLGVETPDFIPSIPTFRNEIKSEYPTASQAFEKAYKEIEEHPDIAIGLANSALESIIKEILKDERIKTKLKNGDTLTKLVKNILKEIKLFPNNDMPTEIRNIASSLMSATQNIEQLRSDKTNFHGKTNEDYLISDSLYTYFIVNSVTTVGLLLRSLYKRKFTPIEPKQELKEFDDIDDDLPF
jgi:hypothetical protein